MRPIMGSLQLARTVAAIAIVGLLFGGLATPALARIAMLQDPPASLQMGTVTVVSPPEAAPVKNDPGVWAIIPGLSTSAYSRAGDNLEITFTAEMYATTTVLVRALVDLVPAQPSEVKFKFGGENFDGTRSFTFVMTNVGAGMHTVEMLWFTARGTTAQIRDRTLSVNSASPTSGASRLFVGFGTPAITEVILGASVKSYNDIPGLSATFRTDVAGQLAVTFSADAHADGGRLFARAIVDGQVLSDVLFAEAGNGGRRGARSHTFVLPSLLPGSHTVRIQWKGEGGQVRLGGRTMSAYVSPASANLGGMLAIGRQLAPTRIRSTSFVNIPTMDGSITTTAPSTSATLQWSGEVSINSGRLFLRALVDSKPVSPGDVTLIQGGSKWRAASFAFTLKNLLPGRHTVQFQAAVDSGKTANIGDRAFRVVFKQRSGAEFSQAYQGLQPTTGIFNTLVICFDPVREGHAPPTKAYLQNMMEGGDGGLSVRGWFQENSGGKLQAGAFTYTGCEDGAWNLAPPAHRGNWYWDNKRFDLMWIEAIHAADPAVDFHAFDRNRDNKITPDELTLIVVRPQNDPYGTNRTVGVKVDGNGTALNFHVVDVYLSQYETRFVNDVAQDVRRWAVGLLVHELSHAEINAWDIYGYEDAAKGIRCRPSTNAGAYSVMDNHPAAGHLDPYHKLKNGFVTADLVELNPLSKASLTLNAVETSGDVAIIYDPRRGDREFFILENRWGGTPDRPTYDSALPGGPGVLLWHIVQDFALTKQFPPPGGEGCDPIRITMRRIGILNSPGALLALRWADGSSAGVQIEADRTDPAVAKVTLTSVR